MKKYFMIFVLVLICFNIAACMNETAREDTGSFSSSDLDGNEVTDSIFEDKDVTILNVWGTYCGPCLGEMPELSALSDSLPENAQIIGMVIDVTEGDTQMIKTAQKICQDNHITYPNIVLNESVQEYLSGLEAVPTTFILDSTGKAVCDPIVGAYVEKYKQAVQEYLEQRN